MPIDNIQYNPSTGKVSYNNVSEKVQFTTISDCLCFVEGRVPDIFRLTFANVLDCGGTSPCKDAIDATELNAVWDLTLFDAATCEWSYTVGAWLIIFSLDRPWGGGAPRGIEIIARKSGCNIFLIGAATDLDSCTTIGSGVANEYVIGECAGSSLRVGYDGTVSWEPL